MKNNKLFVGIFTPSVQSFKELLTGYFLTIDNSTSLGSDIQIRITTLRQLIGKISLKNCSQLFRCVSTNQNFLDTDFINRGENVVTLQMWCDRLAVNLIHLNHLDFRRKNVTTFNQFGCRNSADYITIDGTIIHAWFSNSDRSLASCSKEIATICLLTVVLSGREKVTFDTVMCLVKVNRINLNLRVH